MELTGVAVIAAVAGSCILYTDPINTGPAVEIIPPSEMWRNTPAVFTASAQDPDQDAASLALRWRVVTAPCPDAPSPTDWPDAGGTLVRSFPVKMDTTEPFCVWVSATDRHGAVAIDVHQAAAANRAPSVVAEIIEPMRTMESYRLFSSFRVSAGEAKDADGDPLMFRWTLRRPGGADEPLAVCPGGDERFACFNATVDGAYIVSVVASDAWASSALAKVTAFVAKDAPPCIDDTSPELAVPFVFASASEARVFQVDHVDDDGDPYPAGGWGGAAFAWFVDYGQGAFLAERNAGPSFTLPAGVARIGDTLKVRVEAFDRRRGEADRALGCAGNARLCGVAPGCAQRVTWEVRY